MDEWHDNTTSVRNQIPTSATKSPLEDVIPSSISDNNSYNTKLNNNFHTKKEEENSREDITFVRICCW